MSANLCTESAPSVLKTIEANEDGGSIDFNNLDTEDVDFQDVRRMTEE
jgi:hypothetical protein